jgi:hypothetical protein
MAKKKDEGLFDSMNEETNTGVEVINLNTPDRSSKEWNDYVMGLFTEDEIIMENNKPFVLVNGLRRVSELVLGTTTFSGPTQVFPSNDGTSPGRATVVYTVNFLNGESYSEVADCWHGNTDDAFLPYTVAMASTRAEARALRKALKIKAAAFEEITKKDTSQISKSTVNASLANKPTDGDVSGDVCSPAQENFIISLCERNSIDKDKFVNVIYNVRQVGNLNKRLAGDAIDLLQAYFKKDKEIPAEILR